MKLYIWLMVDRFKVPKNDFKLATTFYNLTVDGSDEGKFVQEHF